MWTWKAGDRAVCINDKWHASAPDRPAKGAIFTVRKIKFFPAGSRFANGVSKVDALVLFFEELKNGFQASHFRPVRPTSIECFRVHLERVSENV